MATNFWYHLFFFLLYLLHFSVSPSLSASTDFPKSGFITLPIHTDPITNQYSTSLGIGTPRHNFNLVIDLDGLSVWYDCDKHYNSSSYHHVPCDSKICGLSPCQDCNNDGPLRPGCTNQTCIDFIFNPFVPLQFPGNLGEDLLYLPGIKVPHTFFSACQESDSFKFTGFTLLSNLTKGAKGMLGLAKTRFALPNQISSKYNVPPKFTLCLPSSMKRGIGKLFIGGRPNHRTPVPVSMTGFISSKEEYFIHVKSIHIDNKPIKFDTSLLSIDKKGNGGTKISTMKPFTVLHHSIYKPFVKDFVKKAEDRKIKRVKSLHPFGACFDARTIVTGVPDIKLIVGGRIRDESFEICAHNSLVEARKGVVCLAFVDGGRDGGATIVIGGHQLEDRIMEFDLSTSILSFSSSLLLHNASCSDQLL
ncbi:hypothetical protein RIF29_40662 [Crotalaria pallida]|uniref:Peptidase A1 domain-containing protein n=1 Tax=Crotalaria pallida TaxID=3830 RepID=A0AAN9E4A5_CROPI